MDDETKTLRAAIVGHLVRRGAWPAVGLACAVVACNPPPTQPQKKADKADRAGETGGPDGGANDDNGKKDKPAKKVFHPPYQPKDGEFDWYGPPRDPYGEHDEEEGCPNGDWCGTAELAKPFAVPGLEDKLSCPAKLISSPTADIDPKKNKAYEGLSMDPRMQGRLVTTVTEEARKNGDADACCYHWFDYCSGRPLAVGEEVVVAELEAGADWITPAEVVHATVPPSTLVAELAAAWLADAQMEHASVAAFARLTLELMAVGAPPDLLAGVSQASIDEVGHAKACFSLAGRFGAQAVQPKALDAAGPRNDGLPGLALNTFIEGCVGETIAALVAGRGARACQDAASKATLAQIAADEAQHAALAWEILTFAVQRDPACAAIVRDAAAEGLIRAEAMAADAEPSDASHDLLAWGRLDEAGVAHAAADAWRDIIVPTLESLLG